MIDGKREMDGWKERWMDGKRDDGWMEKGREGCF